MGSTELPSGVSELFPGPIGLIAGNGTLPKLFLARARELGVEVVVAAHRGETEVGNLTEAAKVSWFRVGQVGAILRYFTGAGVSKVAFLGGIRKSKLLSTFRPDAIGLKLLLSLATTNDDKLLGTVAAFLESRGLSIFAPTILLSELLVGPGILTARSPSEDEMRDIAVGWRVAGVLGTADVGQGVVVSRGSVVAVEAIEGTDAMLQRAGALLAGAKGVFVKRAKPQQDLRMDLPTVGTETLRLMDKFGITALVIEAHKTMLADPTTFILEADRRALAVVAMEG